MKEQITKYYCDRCGASTQEYDVVLYFWKVLTDRDKAEPTLLCSRCKRAYKRFMKGKTEDDN